MIVHTKKSRLYRGCIDFLCPEVVLTVTTIGELLPVTVLDGDELILPV